jgi:septum formation protein
MDIILASASPRRKEILGNTNVKFSVIESKIDEVILDNEKPQATVMRLAFEKSLSVAKKNSSDLIIGADTVVVVDGKILGKPKNMCEAEEMLNLLSNKTHQVITGISLINLEENKKVIDFEVSYVKFKDLSKEDIKNYLNTNEYLDKAGAYAVQGYGALLIDKIEGDYFNIVGLPISKLYDILKEEFKINILSDF